MAHLKWKINDDIWLTVFEYSLFNQSISFMQHEMLDCGVCAAAAAAANSLHGTHHRPTVELSEAVEQPT